MQRENRPVRSMVSACALAAFASLAAAGAASAQSTFVDVTPATPVSGTQNYGGSLGLDFTVGATPIQVTQLGAFDDDQDGFNLPITVRLYDRTTQAEITPALVFTGTTDPLVDAYRFRAPASPLTLPAGFQGTIVAEGYGDAEQNGNLNTGGPALSFNETDVDYLTPRFGTAGQFPTNGDGGGYAAGNFQYVVPEPTAAALLVLGGLGLLARRRRRA